MLVNNGLLKSFFFLSMLSEIFLQLASVKRQSCN